MKLCHRPDNPFFCKATSPRVEVAGPGPVRFDVRKECEICPVLAILMPPMVQRPTAKCNALEYSGMNIGLRINRKLVEHVQFPCGGSFQIGQRTCRFCGCSDEKACEGGCSWVDLDLCSACQEKDRKAARA
jgi:hypothetical protein